MDKKVPNVVVNYLRDQLINKRKPIQKAIQNALNYWAWRKDFSDQEAERLLKSNLSGGDRLWTG